LYRVANSDEKLFPAVEGGISSEGHHTVVSNTRWSFISLGWGLERVGNMYIILTIVYT